MTDLEYKAFEILKSHVKELYYKTNGIPSAHLDKVAKQLVDELICIPREFQKLREGD